MSNNVFAPSRKAVVTEAPPPVNRATVRMTAPDYTKTPRSLLEHIGAFLIGFVAGFAVLFVYYKIIPLALIAGIIVGVVYIFVAAQSATRKRLLKLRTQFYDMLEAMSVAMRAGNPVLKALESAREDLTLIYSETSDIIIEMDIIIAKFHNAVPLSEAFSDFANRSGLEDVASFASIYATIEGKSSRADEIIRETQQIIGEKMAIEMEIETMMTAAKTEANVMQVMPLVILLAIGYVGGGFMDAIYTEPLGRVVATVGLVTFIVSFIMSRKISNIQV